MDIGPCLRTSAQDIAASDAFFFFCLGFLIPFVCISSLPVAKLFFLCREVLDLAGQAVKVGATTDDVDRVCHEAAVERGAYPSPLNYSGFPKRCVFRGA